MVTVVGSPTHHWTHSDLSLASEAARPGEHAQAVPEPGEHRPKWGFQGSGTNGGTTTQNIQTGVEELVAGSEMSVRLDGQRSRANSSKS